MSDTPEGRRSEELRDVVLDDMSDVEFVTFCYECILGRSSDPVGEQGYLDALASGTSRAQVMFAFLSSEEHLASVTSPFVHFSRPGHFYSPLPSPWDVIDDYDRVRNVPAEAELSMRAEAQIRLCRQVAVFAQHHPFDIEPGPGLRYGFLNDQYGEGDALSLFGMLQHIKPSRVIEVGAGHSTAVMLDTRQQCDMGFELTMIEPFPDRFRSRVAGFEQDYTLIECRVQDVELALYEQLAPGDILFVDSSHVLKFASDLNHLLFQVLPCLADGVWVHFHDVFWPFEYPRKWLREGRAWNEAYALRAFLTNNPNYQIEFFNDFLAAEHGDVYFEVMPEEVRRNPGCGLWIRKVGGLSAT